MVNNIFLGMPPPQLDLKRACNDLQEILRKIPQGHELYPYKEVLYAEIPNYEEIREGCEFDLQRKKAYKYYKDNIDQENEINLHELNNVK